MQFPNFLIMTNKELFFFAAKCLSLDDHPDFKEEIIRIISDETNSQNFVRLCSNHLVLPVIYLKFISHDILPHLPNGLAEFLVEVYHLNLNRNEKILKQVQEIMYHLNKHEIYPTLLKGTGNILDNLYSSTGERMIGDIDLLVSEDDYLRAAQILENDGYFHDNPDYFEVKDMKHYPRLFKKGMPVDVEIHRLPVRIEYTKMYNTDLIDQEKKAINIGFSCFVLSDKHKVIHNFIHSQLSDKGYSYGLVPLRDLYDLYLLTKRTDISQTIPFIQHKSKAISYFLFARKAFNVPDLFPHHETLTSRLFAIKNDLNLRSYTIYRTNKSLVYMTDRINKYLMQIVKSFYSGEMRRSLIRRLSNRHWYKNHIYTYVDFFSRKK
ncbi:MAG TPA: hypothetical protein DCR40_15700 [Prolixibacteraceae bacterium]|nr:hypothetical protein [Prolixibacteraceae bacterium]